MKNFLICSVILFLWYLMFPSNSYKAYSYDLPNLPDYSIEINNKEIRFRILDYILTR